VSWLEEELARYTYKPGWKLTIVGADHFISGDLFENMFAWTHLEIRYETIDSYHPERTIPIGARLIVPPYVAYEKDANAFRRWLEHNLDEMERHERREWLRYDGELVNDPHKVTKAKTAAAPTES